MKIAAICVSLLFLLSLAGFFQGQTGNNKAQKEYEEISQPLLYYADKEYMIRIFGEPTTKVNEDNVDIWNYHLPIGNQGSYSSDWYSNTTLHPNEKFHDVSLYFQKDILIKWNAIINE